MSTKNESCTDLSNNPDKKKIYNDITKIGYQSRAKESYRVPIPDSIAKLFHITSDDFIQWRAIYDFDAKEWKLMANIINMNEIRDDL